MDRCSRLRRCDTGDEVNGNAGKPTFKWNLDTGEGLIGNLEGFRQLPPLLRVNLLKDWIFQLEEEYNDAHDDSWPNV